MRACSVTLLLAFAACTSAPLDKGADSDTDDGVDTDPKTVDTAIETGDTQDTDDTDDTDVEAPTFTVDYMGGRYHVIELAILGQGGIDLDGDGTIDNAVGTLINSLGNLAGILGQSASTYSLTSINQNIQEAIDSELSIILMEGRHTAGTYDVTVDVVSGEEVGNGVYAATHESYDGQGKALQQLTGTFTEAKKFGTGPNPLMIPVHFLPDEPVLNISAQGVLTQVEVTPLGDLTGFLAGVVPASVIKNDVAYPLLDAFSDFLTPGQQTLAKGAIDLAVATNSDITLPGGEKGLSAAFRFAAVTNNWEDPSLVAP